MRAKAQAEGGGLQGRLEEAQGKRSAGPVVKGGGGMRSGGASCRGQRGQPGAGGRCGQSGAGLPFCRTRTTIFIVHRCIFH